MRIVVLALLALAMSAVTPPAEGKPGAKTKDARICASIRSDMRHKGGAYIPAGVKCGKKRAA